MKTYREILEEYEVYPSDIVYVYSKGMSIFEKGVEEREESNRKYNLMSMELSWILKKHSHLKHFSRKKKRKINNRITRYYANLKKRLK